jgi:hypothetical protein
MPSIAAAGFSRDGPDRWTSAQIIALGEFVGSARWATASQSKAPHSDPATHVRSATNPQESFAASADALCGEEDIELGPLLGAIAEDVHCLAAAIRAGIMADFAARLVYARRHLPRQQIPGALAVIRQARAAALAVAAQNAKAELQGRKKAAIAARRRLRNATKLGRPFPR